MPIVQMCDATDPGAVRSDYWTERAKMEIYLHETHAGLVLSVGELNGRDDSDFYAVVWNPETQEPERVTYGSTRGWTYPNNATVDATPEVRAAFAAYTEAGRQRAAEARARCEAMTPTKGKAVTFVRGTTTKGIRIAKGDTGTVFWYGEAREFGAAPRGGYNEAARASRRYANARGDNPLGLREGYRVGVALADNTRIFTAATNVLVTEATDTATDTNT